MQKGKIRSDGRNLGSPVPFVLVVISFEMYRGVCVDDVVAKLQGATRFQHLHSNSFWQRQFQAWPIYTVLLSIEASSIIQNDKTVSRQWQNGLSQSYHFHRAERQSGIQMLRVKSSNARISGGLIQHSMMVTEVDGVELSAFHKVRKLYLQRKFFLFHQRW